MKHYHVVCAVIRHEGEILCMRRALRGSTATAGKWEFPGGKVEAHETPEAALERELREEMDYEVRILRALPAITHQYPDFSLSLQAFLCEAATRKFHRKEHIDHRWCAPKDLPLLDWAAADEALIRLLSESNTIF